MDAKFAVFFFSFFSEKCTIVLGDVSKGSSCGSGNQTPPSTAVLSFSDETRSAVAGLRQSNSHLKPRIAAGEERDAK